jgi:hypothetical protein
MLKRQHFFGGLCTSQRPKQFLLANAEFEYFLKKIYHDCHWPPLPPPSGSCDAIKGDT